MSHSTAEQAVDGRGSVDPAEWKLGRRHRSCLFFDRRHRLPFGFILRQPPQGDAGSMVTMTSGCQSSTCSKPIRRQLNHPGSLVAVPRRTVLWPGRAPPPAASRAAPVASPFFPGA